MRVYFYSPLTTALVLRGGEVVEVKVPQEVVNVSWQIWEAVGLSLYCDVVLSRESNYIVNADVVFCPADTYIDVAYGIARQIGVPLVMEFISAPRLEPDEVWRKIFNYVKYVDGIVCVSPFVYRQWVKWLRENNLSHIPITYIPHGVNDLIASKVNIYRERKGYITISALFKHKRIDLLIKLFGLMLRDDLTIVGMGPEYRELLVLNRVYGEPAKFLGIVDEYTKFELLASSRAFVSATHSEQFFIPMVEANYMATPAIAYKQHVVYELHQFNPAVFWWEKEDEFIKLVEWFDTLDNDKVIEIGLRGRKYVEENNMTLTRRSKLLADFLREVVENRKR